MDQRLRAQEEGYENAVEWLSNPVIRDFVLLYWAEGAKLQEKTKFSGCLCVSNTDPALITKIIRGAAALGLEKVGYRLIMNHAYDAQEEIRQWSTSLKIDPNLIGITVAKIRNRSNIPGSYNGRRCVMKVHFTGSSIVSNKILGMTNFLRDQALGGSKQDN